MSGAPIHDDRPLGLTVHTLPEPSAALQSEAGRTRSGRWRMLLVMLVCAAPVLASYFTYYVVRPEGRRNFGELINPQRPLPAVTARNLEGKPVELQALKGQWLFMSVASGACDALCKQNLYLQRQLRESLGKEKDRVDWVWLITDETPVPLEIVGALKDATVLRVPAAEVGRWLQAEDGHAIPEHLYLVDPLGNWMMRFPPALSTDGALKAKRDLDRLMRAAQFWDRPGRD